MAILVSVFAFKNTTRLGVRTSATPQSNRHSVVTGECVSEVR